MTYLDLAKAAYAANEVTPDVFEAIMAELLERDLADTEARGPLQLRAGLLVPAYIRLDYRTPHHLLASPVAVTDSDGEKDRGAGEFVVEETVAGSDVEVIVEEGDPSWVVANKPWRRPFIDALGLLGDVSSACRAVGVSRQTAYRNRQEDEAFAVAWADAIERSADILEFELRKWATQGVPTRKTVTRTFKNDEGKDVVEVTVTEGSERSVTAAIFLLKGLRPGKYRENVRHEHHPGGGAGRPAKPTERERSPRRLEELLEIASEVGFPTAPVEAEEPAA